MTDLICMHGNWVHLEFGGCWECDHERLTCCGCYVLAFYNFRCRWCGTDYSKRIDPMTEEVKP